MPIVIICFGTESQRINRIRRDWTSRDVTSTYKSDRCNRVDRLALLLVEQKLVQSTLTHLTHHQALDPTLTLPTRSFFSFRRVFISRSPFGRCSNNRQVMRDGRFWISRILHDSHLDPFSPFSLIHHVFISSPKLGNEGCAIMGIRQYEINFKLKYED